MAPVTNRRGTDRRAIRMARWDKLKQTYGRRGWKASKKHIKRQRRDLRIELMSMKNAMIDNAVLST